MEHFILEDDPSITSSPKREREDETVKATVQSKRLRKAKVPIQPKQELKEEKTRGRYACLGHRMKHKRCPLDCPERRPRPESEPTKKEVSTPTPTPIVVTPIMNNKIRAPRTSSAKKNVLTLEECTISNTTSTTTQSNQPALISTKPEALLHVVPQQIVPTAREVGNHSNWDSVEWEGLMWDSEHCLHGSDWLDLKSSSHWEEAKSKQEIESTERNKAKFEEDDEIIDSWLNDEGLGSPPQFDMAERNASETDVDRNTQGFCTLQQLCNILPKILLTRDMLERWSNEPYFNKIVKGCFVRVRVGEYLDTPIFRIAHIEDVVDTYSSYDHLSLSIKSMKGLILHVGTSGKKTFPISNISNQLPMESEIRLWQEESLKCNFIFNPLELQQKEEIIRAFNIKYPALSPMDFTIFPQSSEPIVNEPTIWSSC